MSAMSESMFAGKVLGSARGRFACAVAAAVLIHLSLCVFKMPSGMAAGGKKTGPQYDTTKAFMLPQDGSFCKELLSYMDDMDPRDTCMPSRPAAAVIGGGIDVRPDMEYRLDIAPKMPADFVFQPLKTEARPMKDLAAGSWKPVPADNRISTVRGRFLKDADYPVWRTMDGSVLPQIFKDPATVRQAAVLSATARPTVLSIRSAGEDIPPVVEVESSCGSKDLDSKAVTALVSRPGPLGAALKDAKGRIFIEITWRRGN